MSIQQAPATLNSTEPGLDGCFLRMDWRETERKRELFVKVKGRDAVGSGCVVLEEGGSGGG